jgi:hypothetical protein
VVQAVSSEIQELVVQTLSELSKMVHQEVQEIQELAVQVVHQEIQGLVVSRSSSGNTQS